MICYNIIFKERLFFLYEKCGRPATVGICKDCGAVIGGEGYQLRPGNIQHQGSVLVTAEQILIQFCI